MGGEVLLALLWVSPLSRADRETPLPRLGMYRVHRGGEFRNWHKHIHCITRYGARAKATCFHCIYKGEILVVSIVATG